MNNVHFEFDKKKCERDFSGNTEEINIILKTNKRAKLDENYFEVFFSF